MALLSYADTVTLGGTDVSSRLVEGNVKFGGDPYSGQIYFSDGRLRFDNRDGALDSLDDTTVSVVRPALAGQTGTLASDRTLWEGRAQERYLPVTDETRWVKEYELTGLLETALGLSRTVDYKMNSDSDADRAAGSLKQLIGGVMGKALMAAGLTATVSVDVVDIGTITLEDADGAAVEMKGTEWTRVFADITHLRPLDVAGRNFAISRGGNNASNRTTAASVDQSTVMMTAAVYRRERGTIRNVFQNASFETNVPASIAKFGERIVRLPDWLPLSSAPAYLQTSAAVPGEIIDLTLPRWQDTASALVSLEDLTVGRTARIRVYLDNGELFDSHVAVTRLTYRWYASGVPTVRVEGVRYPYTAATGTNWRLGVSRLGADTRLG